VSTSVVPALIDALVTQCTSALTGVTVTDGYGVSGNTGDFLMIGVDDPESEGAANSADVQQTPGPFGTNRPRDEQGEIACIASSWAGGTNQKTVRDAAYAITSGVENLLRSSPSLGVSGCLWTGFGASSQLLQQQFKDGSSASVVFRISFRARI
jgi:hypothetical protein